MSEARSFAGVHQSRTALVAVPCAIAHGLPSLKRPAVLAKRDALGQQRQPGLFHAGEANALWRRRVF